MQVRTFFIKSGVDEFTAKKISENTIHDNIIEDLPQNKMTVEPFYKAPARGQFLLNGFSRPHDDDGELRKSIIVIAQAIENAKKENERVISERELLEALDAIDELAKRGP